MKKTISMAIAAMLAIGAMTACGDKNSGKEAEMMLKEAQSLFENKKYNEAKDMIDSLRKKFPNEIDIRKKALQLYKENELKKAELHIMETDKAISAAKEEYEKLKKSVDELKEKGSVTAEKLSELTRSKLNLDSLQGVFEMECSKIKYINKKKESNPQ